MDNARNGPLPKVAFVCVHNACRSQIAEALGRHLAAGVFESHSAGTEPKPRIDPDALRLMKRRYGIDMEQVQRPKALSALPPVDVVVTMGCGVACPILPCRHREDWSLEDPTGKDEEAYLRVIGEIEGRIKELMARISRI